MKALIKQFGGVFGAAIAAACCLGVPVILSALGAAGLGFLIKDALLFPIFAAFVVFSSWVLYRSARKHGNLAPFWLGLSGGIVSSVALWLLVSGLFPASWAVYVGLALLVAGSLWDALPTRKPVACACEAPAARPDKPDLGRRVVTGTALSMAAAAAFYGMYKSVAAFAPEAKAGDIACFGINSCKGTSACTTAFNACTGQNDCKGRGYLNVPAKECRTRGGVPLQGSPADPAKAKG